MPRKKVTMQTVADRLHLHNSTVSRALLGNKGVSEQTRGRIIAAARQIGYMPKLKPAPSTAHIMLLAEELPLGEKLFGNPVINGLVSEIPLYNGCLYMAIINTDNPRPALPPLLWKVGKIDGVIAIKTGLRAVQAVRQLGLPIVLIDYIYVCTGCDSVVIDGHAGTFTIASDRPPNRFILL